MLADDPLGGAREVCSLPLPDSYYAAFDSIERDPNNELVVAVAANATVVGVLQITWRRGTRSPSSISTAPPRTR